MKTLSRLAMLTTSLLLLLLCGCGDPLEDLHAVEPLFAVHGADWNDYVQGDSWDTATDSACDAATDTACVQGGELRVVTVPALTGCTGLTAADDFALFDWVCDDSTGSVRFISTGLKTGVYLSDLIDFDTPGWRSNFVMVKKDGEAYGVTPSDRWWSNPTVVDNDGGDLSTAGTIYLVTTDVTANYPLPTASALVAEPSVTIHGVNSDSTLNWSVISSTSPFVWIEGTFDATDVDHGVYLNGNQGFATLRNVTARNASVGDLMSGIVIVAPSVGNRLEYVEATQNQSFGVYLSGTSNNQLLDLTVSDNLDRGLSLVDADNNRISGVLTATGNSSADCYVEGGTNPGLDDDADPSDVSTDTVHDGICVPQGASDFTLP